MLKIIGDTDPNSCHSCQRVLRDEEAVVRRHILPHNNLTYQDK